jgi:hypothetical protein
VKVIDSFIENLYTLALSSQVRSKYNHNRKEELKMGGDAIKGGQPKKKKGKKKAAKKKAAKK